MAGCETAPGNFTRNDENGYSWVFEQPESTEDARLCDEALMACPVEAMGDDGDEKYRPQLSGL